MWGILGLILMFAIIGFALDPMPTITKIAKYSDCRDTGETRSSCLEKIK